MRKLNTLTLAATLLTASAAFAQTTVTRGMESSPVTGTAMPDATMPTRTGIDSNNGSYGTAGASGTDGTNSLPASGYQTGQPMNATDAANMNARAPAALDARGTAYDSSLPADRTTTSGMSGTTGGYATGNTQMGNGYGNQYNSQYGGASTDTLNGSGHYADTARGSQLNANDIHATPQPGALNNQLFRGN